MDGLDQERRELVGRLRVIIQAAFTAAPPHQTFEQQARAAATFPFRWHTALRQVRRIVKRYGWEDEIERALDESGAPALKYLDPHRLEMLLERLRALEDCIQTPCDPPDAPPAR